MSNDKPYPSGTPKANGFGSSQSTETAKTATPSPLRVYAPNPEQRYQPFPLTDVQQAYWIGRGGTFELGNVATHGYIELESHGLNLERLKLAVQRLIEHHDMLRAIVLSDGQQQILKQAPTYQIEILDLREQNSEVIASQLQAVRQQMSHQILAADQWPLFEIRASRLDNDCIRLHLSFDYLIVDAWSLGEILAPQLHQLYQNLETVLVPLEICFRDYVLAEIALRDSEVYRNSRDYWFNRLSTLPPAPELPLAKNPSSITKPHFINRSARLQPATWLRLKTRATQAGLTPSGVLLAAFAEVLSVWSKTPKFTLNLTLFNRLPLHPQVNNIVGDFTSLTLLAVDYSTSESFLSRARSLQKQLWQDLEHRHISGVEVLRELARTQGRATTAAMPVVFTSTLTQNTTQQGTSNWEKLGEVVYSISQTPQVWLDHQVSENEGALLLSWDAVEELFPEGFLDDMFAAYCRLLDSLATDESVWQSITLQLLPPAQLKQLAIINATESPVSQAMLHTLFAEQVSRRQHQPAVITPNRTLIYEELHCLAHQVAYRLRQLGVLSNTLVAVVMEKGWQQIVAVLGILQCGAAYLPIDPELPTERRWHIFQQAEVQVVLTQSWLDNTLSWPDSIQSICVDNLAVVDDILPLEPAQTPTDLAYVIYTSGSTGLPKGVMIDHRGAVNTILDINQRFGLGANDRVLALSPLSFDLSVYDIFGTLAAGGTIVIPEATNTKEPAHWLKLIQQHQVTVWNSVPTLMQMLVEYAASQCDELPNSLRLVLLSGDRIPLNLPTQIKSLWENIQIVSLGGATEASIWSILYSIAKIDPTWNTIPYGRPLTNQRFYVFNQALTECPVWIPGQLYIGGVGLAQGYWHDQKKTNASFIIHPQTKERLYKTGDLGRYLPDGNIEFLGREDFQVKINGYRIELGEIEATLQQYPTVKEVVVAVGESQVNQQLVAYIVPQSDLADSNQQQAEAYEPRQLPGVLLDPVERIEFKLKQKGLRQLKPSQSSIQLPKPKFDQILTQEYLQRQSYRQFQDEPISLEMFSQFLSCLLQMQLEDSPLPKYRYPSAGSLYPVQTYLYVKPNRIAGLGAGYYYYHPADHNLILLNAETSIWGNIYSGNQPIFDQSAFSLFLIGQLSAIAPMYGDLARDFCLLEAGYIGQLLMNSAPENQIGICPIGYLKFEKYQDLLSLGSDQILLHSFLGGKIDQAQTRQWLQPPISRKPDLLTEDIRTFLQQKLPQYLLPSTYVFLNSLPLTPNGKVDRKALPASKIVNNNLKEGFVAPRNHTEKTLVAIFGEILGGKEIGIHDNFFELGGDSLKATQVMTRLREAFQVDLPLRRLFDNPTVATLGDRIEELQTQVTTDITVSDREQGRL
ncbi:MAG: amino acid adenylation domain-containing protein [Desmonostoc geniculatum HA4340-LM1]|nr:amino acid adenylation domain-containing protein [Desmonostoc geniculatum HA4340-LM1]